MAQSSAGSFTTCIAAAFSVYPIVSTLQFQQGSVAIRMITEHGIAGSAAAHARGGFRRAVCSCQAAGGSLRAGMERLGLQQHLRLPPVGCLPGSAAGPHPGTLVSLPYCWNMLLP